MARKWACKDSETEQFSKRRTHTHGPLCNLSDTCNVVSSAAGYPLWKTPIRYWAVYISIECWFMVDHMETVIVLLVGDQSSEGSERLALLDRAISTNTHLVIVSDAY